MSPATSGPHVASRPSALRYYGGWFFFILGWVMPLMIPLVPLLGFGAETTAVLAGGLLVGGPELAVVFAVALWGKETFSYFLERTKRLFMRLLLPRTVSPARYYTGLVLLIAASFPSWVLAYAPHLVSDATRILILATADAVFILSFFVLGGDFWGKVRALFIPGPA